MFFMFQAGEVLRIVVIRVALLLAGEQYTPVHIGQSTVNLAAVEDSMAALAQTEVIPYVVLAASAAAEVVDLQPSPPVRLWPPADGAAPMLLHPSDQRSALILVHCDAPGT
jgi:hypothetical protein